MNLKKLESLFSDSGCQKIYVKKLSANDNSKNQVYFGGGFEILNVLPMSSVLPDKSPKGEETFKAKLNFSWIGEDGILYPAPQSQLILYPEYPEVRFSGFLARCENAPSELMTQRLINRVLFIGAAKDGRVLGYVASPTSEIAEEFDKVNITNVLGIFKIIELVKTASTKLLLIKELKRIYEKDWIVSKKLDSDYSILPCKATNCGGLTLEAELGVLQNSKSEPDYLGWEIKNFSVRKFDRLNSSVITLMTPEPNGGIYVSEGKEKFIHQYGYPDKTGKSGREDRMNFGGVHKAGVKHTTTGLRMELVGFDAKEEKIKDVDGKIALMDSKDNEAASWSFSAMLAHWNKKHNQACYVPSQLRKDTSQMYKYGNKVILGMGTDFQFFLKALSNGSIYLDPGTKMENASTKPEIKARSQFRIRSANLSCLYKTNEIIDVTANP